MRTMTFNDGLGTSVVLAETQPGVFEVTLLENGVGLIQAYRGTHYPTAVATMVRRIDDLTWVADKPNMYPTR